MKEKIGDIVWTIYDAQIYNIKDFTKPLFFVPGLPLKLIFANSEILVFKVDTQYLQ